MKYFSLLLFVIGIGLSAEAQEPYFPQFDSIASTWSVLDVNGNQVLAIKLAGVEDIRPFSDGLAAAQQKPDHSWGFINKEGQWQIEPQYANVGDFKDNYAVVQSTCKVCCSNEEGINSIFVGQIIDKKGNTILRDESQNENVEVRYFIEENLGFEHFVIGLGNSEIDFLGEATSRAVINLQGKRLYETKDIYGRDGKIIYDSEMEAIRCNNKYYSPKGKMILNLSKFSYLQPFSGGYAWSIGSSKESDENHSYLNVLVDKKGKNKLTLSNDSISFPTPVENDKFVYNIYGPIIMQYDLATNKSIKYQPIGIAKDKNIFIDKVQKNGCRFFFYDRGTRPLLGFINPEGKVFYKAKPMRSN